MKLKIPNRGKSIKEKDGCFFGEGEDQSIDKPLDRLRKKRDQIEITNGRNERGAIITDPMDIKRTIKKNEQFYDHGLDNLDKMNQVLEKFNLPRLTKGEINNLIWSMPTTKIESIKYPSKTAPGLDGFSEEFYPRFKNDITPILCNF